MSMADQDEPRFLDLDICPEREADVVILPLPLERTVSYGSGTGGAPGAILEASHQVETFDEETLTDFRETPRIHTAGVLQPGEGGLRAYLDLVKVHAEGLRSRFVLGLGGEHTVTYGLVHGLARDPAELTLVQIDAHADLADELDGRRWSHGTVMRRLWEEGASIIQIGVRSLSREEYELVETGERITTYFAYQWKERRTELMGILRELRGPVYLTIDVDGLDPSVVPSTGTPQPGGLSWSDTMEILRSLTAAPQARLLGCDIVEYVPSPHPPGSDIVCARLGTKIIGFWAAGKTEM
jgi:agmatinase